MLGRIDARTLSRTKHRKTHNFQSTHAAMALIQLDVIWPKKKRAADRMSKPHILKFLKSKL